MPGTVAHVPQGSQRSIQQSQQTRARLGCIDADICSAAVSLGCTSAAVSCDGFRFGFCVAPAVRRDAPWVTHQLDANSETA